MNEVSYKDRNLEMAADHQDHAAIFLPFCYN